MNSSNSGSSSSSSSPTKSARPTRLSSSTLQPNRLSPLPPPSRPRTPVSPSAALPLPPPLHLTIRFSSALPDLHLEILTPHQTTVAALKHLIRSRLTAEADKEAAAAAAASATATATSADGNTTSHNGSSNNNAATLARARLRFIHAGRILPDGAALSAVLKPPLPPPPPSSAAPSSYFPVPGASSEPPAAAPASSSSSSLLDPRGKGKAVEGRDAGAQQRVYVNCSIGDALSDAELAAEAALAAEGPVDGGRGGAGGSGSGFLGSGGVGAAGRIRGGVSGGGISSGIDDGSGGGGIGARRTVTRTPRGFDRLLQAGFTPAEVNQLRLQFRSIQAARYTPDTMPSPDTLRGLEDAWIDNNNSGGGGGGSGLGVGGGGFFGAGGRRADGEDGGGGGGDMEEGAGLAGMLDVLVKGMVIGFMFPLGSVGWLIREEAMWSRRWRIFVSLGCVFSLLIGTIRALSGDR